MRQVGRWGDLLGIWDGSAIKLGCDDHCTTINVINSLSNLKKEIKPKTDDFQFRLKELNYVS